MIFVKLLHHENNGYIRKQGFEALVLFVDAIRRRGLDGGAHLTLLQYCIDFTPFANPSMSLPDTVSSGIYIYIYILNNFLTSC